MSRSECVSVLMLPPIEVEVERSNELNKRDVKEPTPRRGEAVEVLLVHWHGHVLGESMICVQRREQEKCEATSCRSLHRLFIVVRTSNHIRARLFRSNRLHIRIERKYVHLLKKEQKKKKIRKRQTT